MAVVYDDGAVSEQFKIEIVFQALLWKCFLSGDFIVVVEQSVSDIYTNYQSNE